MIKQDKAIIRMTTIKLPMIDADLIPMILTINKMVSKAKATSLTGIPGKSPYKYCANDKAYKDNVTCKKMNNNNQNIPILGDNKRLVY